MSNPQLSDSILQGIPRVITDPMNTRLIRPVSEVEVKKAVFSSHPNKAPGPDGMTPIFFQKYWHIIKEDLIRAISSFFHSGNLLSAVNETIITLIPKVESPVLVSQFRPISLCNVTHRIISKILVNRMKPLLKLCISHNQSAFIPERQIIDNLIIAHESIHCLNSRRSGSNAFMALKPDMSKAYDREAGQVRRILERYAAASGQIINAEKSYVFFSKNTEERQKARILGMLGGMKEVKQSKYLGLSMVIGRTKKQVAKRVVCGFIQRNGKVLLWRVLTNPNLLVSQILRGKYFRGASIWRLEAKAGDSWVWRSLLSSKELLQEGIRKLVGDGRNINIWEDNWIPDMGTGRIRTRMPQHCQLKSVHELIKDGRWNEDLLSTLFEEEDCKRIMTIPISEHGAKDRLVLVFSSTSRYTVKNGYAVAKVMRRGTKRFDLQKGSSSRNMEDSGHAEQIWKAAPICWDGLNVYRNSFWHWWTTLVEAKARTEGRTHIELTVHILWQIWKSRNQIQFNNDWKCPGIVVGKAMQEWREYAEVFNEVDGQEYDGQEEVYGAGKWSPPPQHFICLNTDAALSHKDGKIGWGVVARCSRSKLLGAWAGSEQRCGDPTVEEARAIRKGMTIAMKSGWRDIIIQSDCKSVVEKIKLERVEDPGANAVLFDILHLRKEFRNCTFSFVRRNANMVSHSLARLALNLVADIDWRNSFLSWLLRLANIDVGTIAPSDVNIL
ncbi:uncharacterized protein [Coffea arabica]|uniref:Reverse transcriptase domain-containing protein n=1 Tax=Coffea arabica TaxID=13443 RepID=A0ABM4VMH3_COFAR